MASKDVCGYARDIMVAWIKDRIEAYVPIEQSAKQVGEAYKVLVKVIGEAEKS